MGFWVILLLATSFGAAEAEDPSAPPQDDAGYVVNHEVFENETAAKLVQEARSYDPNFAADGEVDRAKSVALYEQAMAAQPGGRINGELTHRIAQLYTFYYAEDGSFGPDLEKAGQW